MIITWVLTTGLLTDTTTHETYDAFQMFCNDFLGSIGVPADYNVTVHILNGTDPDTPPDPVLGLSLATLQLQSVLGLNFGMTPSGNSIADGQVQDDIWGLSDPTGPFQPVPNTDTYTTAAEKYIATSPFADFSNSFELDVTATSGQQAFMPVNPSQIPPFHDVPSTPEPGSIFLGGAALLGLGIVTLRRRFSRANA